MARAAAGAVYVDIEPRDVRGFVTKLRAQLKTQRGLEIPVEFDVQNVDKGLTQVRSGLTKTSGTMRRTADDTDRLSGKFKAFNLLTGLAAPKVIALGAALGPTALGATNLTAALVPTVGILGALPAVAGAGAAALGTLKLATAGFGDSVKALIEGDTEKFNETLEKLSPNAKAAARQLSLMRPELAALQQQVQDRFFAGFAEDIRLTGKSYLPVLRRELPAVSSSMAGFVENFAAGVRQGEAMRGVNDVLRSTSGALGRANDNVRPLTASILSLGTAGAPSVLRLGNAFAVGSGQVASFIQRSVAAGAVTEWVDEAVDTFKVLGGIAYNTGSIIYSVFSAGNTAGGGFLVTLRDITGEAAGFLRSMQGAQALMAVFAGASAITGGLGTVLGELLPALGSALIILSPGIQVLVPALVQLVVALMPLIPALAELALSLVPSLVDVITVLVPVVNFLADALSAVFTWVSQHPVLAALISTIILGVVAFKAFVLVMSAIVVVTKLWAAAQALLNLVFAANPIGLIIVGIIALGTALVLAYRHSETFRNIVQATFRGVAAAGLWMWNSVLKPIWDGMKWYFDTIVFPVWRFLYSGVIKPVFDFIIGYAQFWWTTVSAIFTGVVWFLQNFVFPWWIRLYEVAIKPTFDAIGATISWWWNNIVQPVFNSVVWTINNVLIPAFNMWLSVAKTVFGAIGSSISWVWTNVIKPVFDTLRHVVMNTIPDAFRVGANAVAAAWDAVKNAAKAPIKFVIETVINNGIIDAYNWVASKFGVKKADHVPLPRGFATGGVVPGYAPGVDTVPAILSPGEGILRPEVVKALGAETILAWNKKAMDGEIPRFANGGIVPGRKPQTGGPLDFLQGALDFISDPVGAFKKRLGLDGLLERIGNNDFARMIASVPKNIVEFVVDKVKGFFNIGDGASPALNAPGGSSIGMLHSIAKMFYPGARVSSGFRPGDPGWHGKGLAADLVGGGGAGMRRIAAGFYQLAPNLLELIHTPGGYFVKNGQRRDVYNAATKADHYDHVHVAATAGSLNSIKEYDSGGWLKPGYTMTYNGTGKPEAILTNRQWKTLENNGGGKTTTIVVNYPPDVPTERAIQDAQYRHELLYGG